MKKALSLTASTRLSSVRSSGIDTVLSSERMSSQTTVTDATRRSGDIPVQYTLCASPFFSDTFFASVSRPSQRSSSVYSASGPNVRTVDITVNPEASPPQLICVTAVLVPVPARFTTSILPEKPENCGS